MGIDLFSRENVTLFFQAAQRTNSDQYATTTVTLHVVIKSTHPPQFEKTQYEGFIAADAGQGSMVMEEKSSSKPLKVQAKDADFANVRAIEFHRGTD